MSFIVKPATECLERVAGITMVSFLRPMAPSFALSSVKPIVTEVLGTSFFFPLLPGHLMLQGAED